MIERRRTAGDKPLTWHVVVHGVGYIGQVCETRESLARCAALSRYAAEGERMGTMRGLIFDDDTFFARPSE